MALPAVAEMLQAPSPSGGLCDIDCHASKLFGMLRVPVLAVSIRVKELTLGGSWVVISMVISIHITHIRGLATPLITTPDSPSRLTG